MAVKSATTTINLTSTTVNLPTGDGGVKGGWFDLLNLGTTNIWFRPDTTAAVINGDENRAIPPKGSVMIPWCTAMRAIADTSTANLNVTHILPSEVPSR